MRNRLASLGCAVAILGVTTLAACGGGGSETGAACDTPGVAGDEVNVGLLYPDSGVAADIFAPLRAGIDGRLGAENAAGGVSGRQIVHTWRNDGARVASSHAAAKALIEEDDVFAVMLASVSATGSAPYLSEHGIPVVGMAVEKTWAQYRNMFTFAYSFTGEGAVDTFGRYIQEQGGTKALIIYNATDATVSPQVSRIFEAGLTAVQIPSEKLGIDNSPTKPQIDEIIRRVRAGRIDTIASAIGAEGLAKVVATVRAQGLALPVVLSGGQAPSADLLREYGPRIAGTGVFTAYKPLELDTPAIRNYRNAMARYAPEAVDVNQTLALVGYIIGDMMVRGLQEAGSCPTRQAFIDNLRAVKGYDAGGLVNPIDFEADFGKVEECYSFSEVNEAGTGMVVANPQLCGNRIQ